MVSYIKWGNLYNYQFSFDTFRSRMLCYKTKSSKTPNNYYSLINGTFIVEPEEIGKKEKQFSKKKNYIAPAENVDRVAHIYIYSFRKARRFM